MAREKVDNKLNVVIGTKAKVLDDTTIPENSIVIVTDEELTPSEIGAVEEANSDGKVYGRKDKSWVEITSDDSGYEPDGVTIVLNNSDELEVSSDLEVEWTKVVNKPTFSTVATTGSYNDLSGKPDLTAKLDKDFSALPNQTSPLLTDVLVINRGTVAQKTTLGNLLAQVDAEIFVVVATLPASGLENKIYLVPKTSPDLNDGYDEYIWKDSAWELLGSLTLDLDNYYNKSEVDGLLSTKVNANNPITAGTSPKITYDAKGLVTGGSDLVATDIPNLDAGKITSGTFDVARIPNLAPSKITQDSNNRFVTDTEKSTWNEKQDKLVAGDNISIIDNTISASGGGDVDLSEMAYFDYAGSIYGSKYSLLANAWEHSLTVDPNEISANGDIYNAKGMAQYPDGATEGIIIPNGVTSVGEYAFYNSNNNMPLVIPNSVTSIGGYAFQNWTSNNQPLVIPNSVTSIGRWAFRNWSANDQPLVIPNSVTSIGDSAFNNWTNVPYVEMKSETPPTLSGSNVFDFQKNAPIYVPDGSLNSYKTATNWSNLASRIFPISDRTGSGYEPDGVTIVLNNSNELEVSSDLEVEWTKVVNKPTFSTVATTGSYNDLADKPDLTTKVDKNNAITAGTKTKITYDSKGLVTAGADLEESDIPTLPASKITQDANNRFVTDAEKNTWNAKQSALGFTPENQANKKTTLTDNDVDFPTTKAVKTAIDTAISQTLKPMGNWNASTNTPTLTNSDTTKANQVYYVSVAGTQFGISFGVGDELVYNTNGVIFKRDNVDAVISVNGKEGVVVLTQDDVADGSTYKRVTNTEKNTWNGKVTSNAAITGATKTKITYDSKGLVTAGADLVESDIPTLSPNKITQNATHRFVTDTEKSNWNAKQEALPTITQAQINAGTSTTEVVITPKLLRDNFYTETEIDNMIGDIESVLDTILGV